MRIVVSMLLLAVAMAASKGDFGLDIDPKLVTVSGLSSGGFMAVQVHFAYSSLFSGAGVFAGGPYYCAQNEEAYAFVYCQYATIPIDVSALISTAQQWASSGYIDDLSNLKNAKVYLYSGTDDTVVNPVVMQDLQQMYQQLVGSAGNITTQFTIPSEHCLPTTNYGSSCSYLGSPYINNCGYDGAGAAFSIIYGDLQPKTQSNSNNVISFSQDKYAADGWTVGEMSLADTGYAYIPTACKNNATCALHIAFHGCQQTTADIQDDYYTHGGFNEWAESNNIVVVYPQAVRSYFDPTNPEGCFDWWGYTNSDYAVQDGPQMQTVRNILKGFAGF